MTITLELTPEQETRLQAQAAAARVDLNAYLLSLIESATKKEPEPGESLLDALSKLGVVGVVSQAAVRKDGKAWSEVEGFE